MAQPFKLKQSNALKHGVYSTIGLLPGESPAKFKKHQKDVIDEFRPNGPVEQDIVMTIARALWRKQNLATFQTAQLVKFRYRQLIDDEPSDAILSDDTIVERLREAGIDIARRTVAKYREAMRIPSSVQRRREKQSLAGAAS